MGNVMDAKVAGEKPMAVVQPMTMIGGAAPEEEVESQPEVAEEEDTCPKTNVTLHLFHYRQQMSLKGHSVVKWATSKLLLTEELIKQQRLAESRELQPSASLHEFDMDDDAAWAEHQLAMLTDDEDSENTENLAPKEDGLDSELNHLIKYRLQLRNTIFQVAQEKLRKREKTKLKRLKRRTLISSKKPSNKDKHRQSY